MATKIFVNLSVSNLKKSVDFFTALGYKFNAQFTDESSTCMIISEDIYSMLMTHERFKTFMPNEVCDTKTATEVLICLSCESRGEVDVQIQKAIAAGGTTFKEPMDLGFMYGRSFRDLDGHIWELMYMDPSAVQG